MCKIMAVAGIKKNKLSKVRELVQKMGEAFSKTESDGLGYAAITKTGKIYGEKWLNNDDAFKIHKNPGPSKGIDFLEKYMKDAVKTLTRSSDDIVYDRFGSKMTAEDLNETVGIIMHTRKMTVGSKVISNTHPFTIFNDEKMEDIALIHNGSIKNHDKLTKKYSTCDSEVILHEYVKHFVHYNPSGIQDLADALVGEYANAVLTSVIDDNGTKKPILDIFKSNKDLYVGYVNELEVMVFSTSDTVLKDCVKALGLTMDVVSEIENGKLIRLCAIQGIPAIDFESFTLSRTYLYWNNNNYYDSTPSTATSTSRTPALPENVSRLNDESKKQFEKDFPDLFKQPHFKVEDLTKDEQDLLDIIDPHERHKRVLQLVKKASGE